MNSRNKKKGKIIIGGLSLYYCLERTQAKDTKFVYNDVKNITKSESSSHTESAVVTTITGIDKDSSITYNNVDNITYQGTQAKDTKFVYNDVKNITKESVELHNSYRSSSKSFGVSAGATIGYVQITRNGGSTSVQNILII